MRYWLTSNSDGFSFFPFGFGCREKVRRFGRRWDSREESVCDGVVEAGDVLSCFGRGDLSLALHQFDPGRGDIRIIGDFVVKKVGADVRHDEARSGVD